MFPVHQRDSRAFFCLPESATPPFFGTGGRLVCLQRLTSGCYQVSPVTLARLDQFCTIATRGVRPIRLRAPNFGCQYKVSGSSTGAVHTLGSGSI